MNNKRSRNNWRILLGRDTLELIMSGLKIRVDSTFCPVELMLLYALYPPPIFIIVPVVLIVVDAAGGGIRVIVHLRQGQLCINL